MGNTGKSKTSKPELDASRLRRTGIPKSQCGSASTSPWAIPSFPGVPSGLFMSMNGFSEVAPDPILDLIEAFRRSKVLFAGVKLGLFENLKNSPRTLHALADVVKASPDALEQLLTACLALGLISRVDGLYHNTAISEKYLIQSSSHNLLGYIRYSDDALYPLWGHLPDAVQEGSNRWEQVFGGKENFFDNIYSSPSGLKDFINGMHGVGLLASSTLVTSFDLSPFEHLVDLGGATGHLAIAACQAYPRLKATVYDLAEVCQVAEEYIAKAGLQHRIQTQGANFFADPLPGADLYVLGRILHDWKEDKIDFLLRKCFDHLPPAGGILICEKFLNEERDGPISAALQSLNMLVVTEGKERTASEYEALLRSGGFSVIQAKKTGKYLDVILAWKP